MRRVSRGRAPIGSCSPRSHAAITWAWSPPQKPGAIAVRCIFQRIRAAWRIARRSRRMASGCCRRDGRTRRVHATTTQEDGIAVAPDGRSVISSVGLQRRGVWIHGPSGERQISLEGYAYWPLLSSDGSKLAFRVSRGLGGGGTPTELWTTELASRRCLACGSFHTAT